MRKIIFLLLVAFGFHLEAYTQDSYIKTWMKDGSQVFYALNQHPKVYYSGTSIVLVTDEVQIEHPQGDLMKMTFEEEPFATSISTVNSNSDGECHWSDILISMLNYPPDTYVMLFSSDGRNIGQYSTDAQGFLQIDISHLPMGIYILNIDKINIKILKK